MSYKDLTCVLEGAEPDTPRKLQYYELEMSIPENATVLSIAGMKLLLHGKAENLDPSKLTRFNKPKDSIEGWKLDSKLSYVFSMPRSITTRDGRFYLLNTLYEKNWGYYFPVISTVIKDAKDILEGRLTSDELNELNKGIF